MGKRCREPTLVLLFNGFGGRDPFSQFCGFFEGGVDAGVPGRSSGGCSRRNDDADKKSARTQYVPEHRVDGDGSICNGMMESHYGIVLWGLILMQQ
jgi:hypothetical protein